MSIDIIKENYEKALKFFYSMGNKITWHRDERKGWYYLLNAYYEIIEAKITDHLLYARILKVYNIVSDFDIVSTYIDRLFIYKPIDTNHIQFDIGFVKILCDEIEVIKIVNEKKQGL